MFWTIATVVAVLLTIGIIIAIVFHKKIFRETFKTRLTASFCDLDKIEISVVVTMKKLTHKQRFLLIEKEDLVQAGALTDCSQLKMIAKQLAEIDSFMAELKKDFSMIRRQRTDLTSLYERVRLRGILNELAS